MGVYSTQYLAVNINSAEYVTLPVTSTKYQECKQFTAPNALVYGIGTGD